MQESYHGGGGSRRIFQKQIREMIKNMKKTEIINQKSKEYHKLEEMDAENILKKIQKD